MDRRPERNVEGSWMHQLAAELKPLELSIPQQASIEKSLREGAGVTSLKAQEMIREIAQLCGGIGAQPKMVMSEVLAGTSIKHVAKLAVIDSVAAVLTEAMQPKRVEVAPTVAQSQPALSAPKAGQ